MNEEQIQNALWFKSVMDTFEISDAYKLIGERFKQEIESLKPAYKCKTLLEMADLGGYYRGLNFLFDLIESYKREGEVAQVKRPIDNPEEPKQI